MDILLTTQINPDTGFPSSGGVSGDLDMIHFWWFWFVCILLSGTLFLVLSVFRRKNRMLTKQLDLLSCQNSELRLRSLQMQMNPHFIFNSLTSLQDLILSQNTREALIYLGFWAGVIRTNLENVLEEYIKLSDEIIFLEKYTEMEKARFKGKLNVQFSKRFNDSGIMIPPMIIQPVIENAIKHGVGGNDSGGNIYIDIYSDDERVYITVEDDGIGRVEAVKPEGNSHNGIGLGVIEKRLEILNRKFNSKEHQFEIVDLTRDGIPCGTRVIIKLLIIGQVS